MEVYEITGYQTGVSKAGVNFLQPVDSFQNMVNGYIYRQVLQSRQGFTLFAPRLAGASRIYGIFEHTLPDASKELLAVDANHLYKFNIGTGVFDQIPFAGSLAAYPGFNLSSNEDYVSGTSYPTATNTARFVFTGKGMDHVFFYNGTDVRDFTSVIDNPNYAAPIGGALTKATYVLWFGERLNLVIPTIAGVQYSQGMLYSGIRTTAGNGDKFNIAGSGLLQLDTYQNITGATQLGNYLVLNADRSAWIIEKTRDAFNPYFSRQVPGVLGTNAAFSAVSWADIVKSLGKTGIMGTDTRQTLRVDNKIPNFTADDIDQSLFDLIYGGFDRINNQFLWAYKAGESDGDTQDKVLVGNYEFDTWAVYDMRFSCFGQTDIGLDLAWNDIDETSGNISWAMWDTTEEIWDKIGLGASVQKTLAGDDLGFIYEINEDYDDYYADITAISQATSAVLTVSASAFQVGDRIIIQSVQGMTQINNFDSEEDPTDFEPYIITAATPTSITLNVDSTNFTAYTSGGTITKVISFEAETIPFNPYRNAGRRCFISHVEFLLDTDGGFLKVDVIADEEETPFKEDVLISPNGIQKGREWISMSVDNEANFMTFRLKQESPATQVKLTSMRIHCKPGGTTSY